MPGKRRVCSIAEVTGVEGDAYTLNELFRCVEDPADPLQARFEHVAGRSHFASRIQMLDLKDL